MASTSSEAKGRRTSWTCAAFPASRVSRTRRGFWRSTSTERRSAPPGEIWWRSRLHERERLMATRAFEIIRDRVREHPAVKAWRELQPAWVGPESIHVLRERMSSATYRLIGVVPGDSTVIAK